jgi:lipoprotein-anchoring transpeptidase ErfK/SrfK
MPGVSRFRPLAVALAVLATTLLVPAHAEGGGDPTVFSFGSAPFHGSTEGTVLAAPIVGMAPSAGNGYWLVSSDGGIFTFNAPFYGSAGAIPLNKPIVGMAAHPSGTGYWLVASDGGIFTYGNAAFLGSMGGRHLNQPIVGMASTPDGNGYWLVARDGGIFSFGNAGFYGSMGGTPLNQPVVGMASHPGGGYWMVASDGGIFAFNAPFLGSMGSVRLVRPVTSMAATPTGNGYWMVGADGGVFTFGDAGFYGSGSGRVPPGKKAVAIAAVPTGGGYWIASGADVMAPGTLGHSVRAVQQRMYELGYWVPVDGQSGFLMQQATWALQKAAGLPRTGTIGGAERSALERAVRPPVRSRSGYVIEIDKARQIIVAVRDGQPIWVFNTSTGNGERYRTDGGGTAVARTPEGSFSIYRHINGMRTSDLGNLWRPKYFTGGYAIHGSPSIPPYPASHGCSRVSNGAIDFIWAANVMPLGTPVLVYS